MKKWISPSSIKIALSMYLTRPHLEIRGTADAARQAEVAPVSRPGHFRRRCAFSPLPGVRLGCIGSTTRTQRPTTSIHTKHIVRAIPRDLHDDSCSILLFDTLNCFKNVFTILYRFQRSSAEFCGRRQFSTQTRYTSA